jgi:MoaA/NifB/PqqE/SkfB family radical SAM enzyme
MVNDSEWTAQAKPLMFLDLKLGNICNLKCRICGSWSSSQFAVEEIAHSSESDLKSSFAYQMLKAGMWQRENKKFWQEIDQIVDQIRYIEFTGGEPFMIEEHFQMLQGIVDRGIAHQVEIHYNTNGTHYPEHAVEIWRHFKTVEIAFSIDDVGRRFEYQRTNAVWTEVQANISRFHALRTQYPNIQLQCCTTVNVFNVLYIDQVAEWIAVQGFDFVYWNIMHDAWYFSIASLPDSVKAVVAKHLKTCDVPKQWEQEFDNIIYFMKNGNSTDGSELKKQIKLLDTRRNQSLGLAQPKLAELIGYDV